MFVMEKIKIDPTDANRTVFMIPKQNMPRFEAECEKLSKKSKRFGGYGVMPIIVGRQEKDRFGIAQTTYEVVLDCEPVKMEGWSFVARIDHSQETGNIIRMVPNSGVKLDERFRDVAPNCEHCNHKRKRRDTFVLRHEDGTFRQVGSTCISDFLGHDAKHLARMAELLGYLVEAGTACERSETFGFANDSLNDHRYLNLIDFLGFCAAACRVHGWVSGKAAYEDDSLKSTRSRAIENIFSSSQPLLPNDDDRALADRALEWAQSFADKDELSDYEHNVLVVANSLFIEYRAAGIAASIVGVFYRNEVRDNLRKALPAMVSQYYGVVGQKVKLLPVTISMKRLLDTGSTLFKFVTSDGSVLSWFSTTAYVPFGVGDKVVLSGTIREHREYKGFKATGMTRCKVSEIKEF